MSNGSDNNVANVTKNDIDILNALIYVYEARLPNYNELMDSEVKSLKNILADYTRQKQLNEEHKKVNGELRQAINTVEKEKGEWIEECQQKDKQIQELEEELSKYKDIDYMFKIDSNENRVDMKKIYFEWLDSIPKQIVIDKIEEYFEDEEWLIEHDLRALCDDEKECREYYINKKIALKDIKKNILDKFNKLLNNY